MGLERIDRCSQAESDESRADSPEALNPVRESICPNLDEKKWELRSSGMMRLIRPPARWGRLFADGHVLSFARKRAVSRGR
jgi:hypothetical protein